jgi:hypothetical protein
VLEREPAEGGESARERAGWEDGDEERARAREEGAERAASEAQSANAKAPIARSLAGRATAVRRTHPRKELLPSNVTESGSTHHSREVRFAKALSRTSVILSNVERLKDRMEFRFPGLKQLMD